MADPKLITPPLSEPFTEGDMTVDVQINRLEDTQWTLEVFDGEGTSTVWEGLFETATDAKAEFLRTVAEEGLVAAISGESAS
jgi:hypothetical protein